MRLRDAGYRTAAKSYGSTPRAFNRYVEPATYQGDVLRIPPGETPFRRLAHPRRPNRLVRKYERTPMPQGFDYVLGNLPYVRSIMPAADIIDDFYEYFTRPAVPETWVNGDWSVINNCSGHTGTGIAFAASVSRTSSGTNCLSGQYASGYSARDFTGEFYVGSTKSFAMVSVTGYTMDASHTPIVKNERWWSRTTSGVTRTPYLIPEVPAVTVPVIVAPSLYEVLPWLDPLAVPVFGTVGTSPIPYDLIPMRFINPYRCLLEQTVFGYGTTLDPAIEPVTEIAPGYDPGVTFTPGAPPTTSPHARKRPGKKKKEKKTRSGAGIKVLGWLNPVTEFNDLVNALYKALPTKGPAGFKARGPIWDEKNQRWRGPNQIEKFQRLFKYADHIDWVQATKNIAYNHIEDFVIGKIGMTSAKASKAASKWNGRNLPIGYQAGLAM